MTCSMRKRGSTLFRLCLGLFLIDLVPRSLSAQQSSRELLGPLPAVGSFSCVREPVRSIAGVQTPIRAKLVSFIGSTLPDSTERMVQVSLDSAGRALAYTEVLTTRGGPTGASTATLGVRFENMVPGLSAVSALARELLDSQHRQAPDPLATEPAGAGRPEGSVVAGQRVPGALRAAELVRVASLTEEMLARCR